MTKLLWVKLCLFLTFPVLFLCYLIINPLNALLKEKWIKINEDLYSHSSPFLSLSFTDFNNGVAITSNQIKKTTDGGNIWEITYENEDISFNSLIFSNNRNGWIVGMENREPIILNSQDKGLHWQKVRVDKKFFPELDEKFNSFQDICANKFGKVWLVGDGGIVEATVNEKTLEISNIIPTEENLFSVHCNENNEVWAVGEKGAVFHYQNSWTKKIIDNSPLLTKVKSINNKVWILGGLHSQGILLRSQDNGISWENKTPSSSDILFDIHLKDSQGWLVGANGNIFYTDDDGNSWMKSKSPTENDLLKIFFTNNDGWIAGNKGTVLKYQN